MAVVGLAACSDDEIEKRLRSRKRISYSSHLSIEKGCRLCVTFTAGRLETLPAVQDGIITVSAASEKDSFDGLVGVDRPRKYLKRWKAYFESKFPKAIRPEHMLLSGGPGTGKTSFARAAAKAMGVPYLVLSCTDLHSPAAVKHVFSQIRKYSGEGGAVVFFDEIDAIAGDRDVGKDAGYTERLDVFLSEVSGFNENCKALLIGATNRLKAVDEAVTRCGRFGQTFCFGTLTPEQRSKLVDLSIVEMGQEPLAEDVRRFVIETTDDIAPVTIKSILAELYMSTDKDGRDRLAYLAARRRIMNGVGMSSRERLKESEIRAVAAHEAGHAVMSCLREPGRPFVQTTIFPEDEDSFGYLERSHGDSFCEHTKAGMLNRIDVSLAGSVAQEILAEPSDGGMADLEMATQVAVRYIQAGFCDEYGLATPGDGYRNSMNFERMRPHLNALLASRREQVRKDLRSNKAFLRRVTGALIEKSVLMYEDVVALGGKAVSRGKGRAQNHV